MTPTGKSVAVDRLVLEIGDAPVEEPTVAVIRLRPDASGRLRLWVDTGAAPLAEAGEAPFAAPLPLYPGGDAHRSRTGATNSSRRWLVVAGAALAILLAVLAVTTHGSASRVSSPSPSTTASAAKVVAPVATAAAVRTPCPGLVACPTDTEADRYVRFSDQCVTMRDGADDGSGLAWLQRVVPWIDLNHGQVVLCAEDDHLVLHGYDSLPR
jgi:hypothetical protein